MTLHNYCAIPKAELLQLGDPPMVCLTSYLDLSVLDVFFAAVSALQGGRTTACRLRGSTEFSWAPSGFNKPNLLRHNETGSMTYDTHYSNHL